MLGSALSFALGDAASSRISAVVILRTTPNSLDVYFLMQVVSAAPYECCDVKYVQQDLENKH